MSRYVRVEEEDAAQIKLGKHFDQSSSLSVSEVKLLLEHIDKPGESAVYKKTLEYVNQFAKFASYDATQASRQILGKGDVLEKFEQAQLATLCPDDADEAKSLIPSLVGKDDAQLQQLLAELSGLKKYQA